MAFRRTLVLCAVLVFILAGCFRQASDPLEEIESNDSDSNVNTNIGGDDPTPTQEIGDGEPTQIPFITSTPIVLETPTDLPLEVPTETPVAPASVPEEPTNGAESVEPTATAQFLTPNAAPATSAVSTLPPVEDSPTATPSGLVTPTDMARESAEQEVTTVEDGCIYVVQSGDNLFRISMQYGKTLAEVVEANPGVNAELIQPGDESIIPDCESDAAEAEAPVAAPTDAAAPTAGAPAVQATQQQIIHTVAAGETLGVIARSYGISQLDIIQANNLTNPDRLSIGQELIIPASN